jgi:hypothetical protein
MSPGSSHDAYLAARISFFVAAHATERLCPECWHRTPVRRAGRAARPIDEPGWCAGCGRRSVRGLLVASLLQTGTSPARRPRASSDADAPKPAPRPRPPEDKAGGVAA